MPATTSMTEPIPQVQFNLSLDTVIGSEPAGYDEDGPTGSMQVTLGDRIAEMVAANLSQSLKSEVRQGYYKSVRDRVDEITDEIVHERLRPVFDREFTPTDPFGAAVAPPTTLTAQIAERAEKWLTAPYKNSGYGDRKTNLQHEIDEAVGRMFKSEIKKAVDAAKAQAVAVISKQAGEVFAEIIAKAAKQ